MAKLIYTRNTKIIDKFINTIHEFLTMAILPVIICSLFNEIISQLYTTMSWPYNGHADNHTVGRLRFLANSIQLYQCLLSVLPKAATFKMEKNIYNFESIQ